MGTNSLAHRTTWLRSDLNEVLDCIIPKVTDEMNDMLCKVYSDEEISNALFQIGPLNAPVCDGLPARFF